MNLSKRLQRVIANVKSGKTVADIGCDHGFASIALVQNGQAERVIAMDINEGPLERARGHISQYHMQDTISVRLSDGAKKLQPGEADTLLISGMGGALITKILTDSKKTVMSAKELVLSPQSEIHLVRKCVHELGFAIAHEEMVEDQGKYYVIIRAVPGRERYADEIEYTYGKCLIEEKDAVFLQFLHKEEKRTDHILKHMSYEALSEEGMRKKAEIQKEKEQILAIRNRMCTE
ncbi:MAG: class I SAM-dependent methyltransferase [Butyribacter sp.]|nr:class I SAM-dependent methyltransferase [bacterium]MDY3855181.1 class I SAM-dependent methyltransferase [Butyribacter sp.]